MIYKGKYSFDPYVLSKFNHSNPIELFKDEVLNNLFKKIKSEVKDKIEFEKFEKESNGGREIILSTQLHVFTQKELDEYTEHIKALMVVKSVLR